MITNKGGDGRLLPLRSNCGLGFIVLKLSPSSIEGLQQILNSLHEQSQAAVALRLLRNKLLGHEALKRYVTLEMDLVRILVKFLNEKTTTECQLQAITILGSIAYGGNDEMQIIIEAQIPQFLLIVLSVTENERILEMTLRALRTIYRYSGSPRELPFHSQVLPKLLIILKNENGIKLREYCAIMLANCCDSREKQAVLGNSGVVPLAFHMIVDRNLPSSGLEATLDLLAALTRDNYENCKVLSCIPDCDALFSLFQLLQRNVTPEIKIFAAICLTNLTRAGLIGNGVNGGSYDQRLEKILIPSLVSLMTDRVRARERAAEVLALLVGESEKLQMAACENDAIPRLGAMLQGSSETNSEGEKRAALLAYASICSLKEDCRRRVIEARILPHVVQAMGSPEESVRSAACQCTRSLSRSVKNLRTALVDVGMIKPLLRLLYDSSEFVQKTACAALCNLVLDFSPMKEVALKEGGVARLVELSESSCAELKFNAVWAIKNLLCLAETPIKLATLDQLTFTRLEHLANDADGSVQEQALNLLRNLVCEKEKDISEVLEKLDIHRLIKLIEQKINSNRLDIVLHAFYVIANSCTASSGTAKDAVIQSDTILRRITTLLQPGQPSDIQLAALWCVINLTWTDDAGSSDRISMLRSRGIERQLEQLATVSSLPADVRDRVQTALDNFTALNTTSHD